MLLPGAAQPRCPRPSSSPRGARGRRAPQVNCADRSPAGHPCGDAAPARPRSCLWASPLGVAFTFSSHRCPPQTRCGAQPGSVGGGRPARYLPRSGKHRSEPNAGSQSSLPFPSTGWATGQGRSHCPGATGASSSGWP